MHSLHPFPLPWVMRGWVPGPFFRTFIQEGLRSNCYFGWELALQVTAIFFWWDLKAPYIKDKEYEFKQKNESDCNFYNFSILVPYTNKFLVFCIFCGIYSPSPLPTNIFFVRDNFCFNVWQLGAGKIQILGGEVSVLGGPNFLFGRGWLDHFLS